MTMAAVRFIMVMCILYIAVSDALNMDQSPRSVRESILSTIRTGVAKVSRTVLPVAGTALLAPVFKADAQQGQLEYQPALQGLDYGKPRTYYPDYVQVKSGLQYKVVKEGDGESPKDGDRAVIDWEGYTIGYYGRPFQTRNKVKGGAFDSTESDNFRWVLGSGQAVAALDEGVRYMKVGGITQIVVPAELGYPRGDPGQMLPATDACRCFLGTKIFVARQLSALQIIIEHDLVGPKPTTFSGQRALNFVLDNQNLIDKTLLINVKLVRVDKNYEKKNKKT
jgi:FKBP-type peptidyl-prolyl cis-trans isomerase